MSGQVKGAQLVNTLKALRTQRERAQRHLPPELHHYLEERVMVSSWYPETDYKKLLHALGRVLEGQVKGNVWRFIGESGAKNDTQGAYATTVRLGDPAATLQMIARAWSLHHDAGRVVVKPDGPRSALIELHDYAVIDAKLAEINAGYACGLLRAAGARGVEARVLGAPPSEEGPTVIEVTWE